MTIASNIPISEVVCSLFQCINGSRKSSYVDVLIALMILIDSLLQRRQLLFDTCGQFIVSSLHNTDT